ncbi:MAG TPA: hypothetical protein ENI54_02485 [bacterium]|nr:hypothetical protein [bacterium]
MRFGPILQIGGRSLLIQNGLSLPWLSGAERILKGLISFKELTYEDYDFSKKNISVDGIEKYLRFARKTGLKALLTSKKITNLVDYMIGVGGNARKNRCGVSQFV